MYKRKASAAPLDWCKPKREKSNGPSAFLHGPRVLPTWEDEQQSRARHNARCLAHILRSLPMFVSPRPGCLCGDHTSLVSCVRHWDLGDKQFLLELGDPSSLSTDLVVHDIRHEVGGYRRVPEIP